MVVTDHYWSTCATNMAHVCPYTYISIYTQMCTALIVSSSLYSMAKEKRESQCLTAMTLDVCLHLCVCMCSIQACLPVVWEVTSQPHPLPQLLQPILLLVVCLNLGQWQVWQLFPPGPLDRELIKGLWSVVNLPRAMGVVRGGAWSPRTVAGTSWSSALWIPLIQATLQVRSSRFEVMGWPVDKLTKT